MSLYVKLLLFAGVISYVTIGCKTAIDSNPISSSSQSSTFFNSIELASFQYTRSDVFKTGKVAAPKLALAADSIIYYKNKKYQVTLKHFSVGNSLFSIGSLATNNSTVLLFTKEKHLQTLEVKGVGAFEFKGIKEDKYFFRLTQNGAATTFSLSLIQPEVSITEYTVEGE